MYNLIIEGETIKIKTWNEAFPIFQKVWKGDYVVQCRFCTNDDVYCHRISREDYIKGKTIKEIG